MPDFSQLLRKPAGEAKKPPVLPMGDYPAVVRGFEFGDQNRNKTPYVRFQTSLQDWPKDSSDEWTVVDGEGNATVVCKDDVDLSKRSMRKDFFLTEDSLWRFDEFIRSCGINPNGRMYEEIIPEIVGQPVLAEVTQYLNQQTNETGNQIGKLVGFGA